MIDIVELLEGWSRTRVGGRPEQFRVWSHGKHGVFVAGLFDWYQTHGMPLDMGIEVIGDRYSQGFRVCPKQEAASAFAAGWSADRFESW